MGRDPPVDPPKGEHEDRVRRLPALRGAYAYPALTRGKVPRPLQYPLHRQELRGTRYLARRAHQLTDWTGRHETGLLGRRQHPRRRGHRLDGRALPDRTPPRGPRLGRPPNPPPRRTNLLRPPPPLPR